MQKICADSHKRADNLLSLMPSLGGDIQKKSRLLATAVQSQILDAVHIWALMIGKYFK